MHPLKSSFQLNCIHTTVVDARKDGHHTEYAIRVYFNISGKQKVVYRRFSAFLQLQLLAQRQFQDGTYCCGGERNCLLTQFLEPLFDYTEFPKLQGALFGKNSKLVVRDRLHFLNSFLIHLEEAICKIPPGIITRCENEGCKMTKLIKSFYGHVDL
uniref:AlNc14C273G9991 protein n=1 Tax=Albugo laibachii Nc14 TaxID=890382 RepID=F0WUI0_9STRA|nr:AlNc14C273G9991 [Albugo laibachii Nc14]|eukprot:CCA25061.1 AlNc14C273G9991 [Albugo laibachii Nc14]